MFLLQIISKTIFTLAMANVCEPEPIQVAWSLSQKQFNLMTSESELNDNRKIAVKTKIKKIESHIRTQSHTGLDVISTKDLAETIVRVSECTGTDFAYLSAVLRVESRHCLDRYNQGSGASGCGQFTSAPMKVFKNQLRLPGKKENGHPKFKKAIEILLNSCFKNDTKRVDYFKEVFSLPISDIQKFLRSGKDIELDIIASAIYLKFKYARSGFYYNPNSKKSGALSLYGEGSKYGTKVHNQFEKVQYQCFDQEAYLFDVLAEACPLTSDKGACELPSIEI